MARKVNEVATSMDRKQQATPAISEQQDNVVKPTLFLVMSRRKDEVLPVEMAKKAIAGHFSEKQVAAAAVAAAVPINQEREQVEAIITQ